MMLKFFKYYIPILGLFWIIYFLNARLRSRTINSDDSFTDIILNTPVKFGVLAIILICIHVFIIKSILETIFEYESKNLFPSINRIVNVIYWDPLLYIYNKIAPNVPLSGKFFATFTKLLNKFKLSRLFLDFAIIFDYIPRLLIAISFMLDVIIYNNMFHFYSVVIYIIIPIVYKIILKMYIDFPLRNYSKYDKYFEATMNDEGSYEFTPKNGYKLSSVLCDEWAELKDIEILGSMFKETCSYYSKSIYLVTSTCYIISWTYILCICIGIL